jgi:hypothetical protein
LVFLQNKIIAVETTVQPLYLINPITDGTKVQLTSSSQIL